MATLRERVEQKRAAPLREVDISDKREEVASALSELRDYNMAVFRSLELIQQARLEVKQADPSRAEMVLKAKIALKAKLSSPILMQLTEYQQFAAKKAELTKKKARLQEDLKSYVATTISTRQKEINDLLLLFGANFQIAETKASFIGREANTEYAVALGAHVLRVGTGNSGEPSFKTVLSAGDKFTLALALFFTQVRADTALGQATVIFDDPFSSQDMQRQWETGSQIRQLAKRAGQVIVFSHDPRFLHLIDKDAEQGVCSTFQISFESDVEAAIKQWSSTEELKEIYVRQAERIRHYANSGVFLADTNAESLIKDLRPFLEDFVKLRFPGRFGSMKMLDAMVDEIDAAGPSDPLFQDIEHLRALNEYTRANHHGGSSHPDTAALRAQCHRVLMVLGRY